MSQRLSNVVRRKFIDYFVSKHGHTFVPSSPVVLKADSSLSFVNAGMNQFKPLFLADSNAYNPSRVCNHQKCIRVGGKKCDMELIGRDLTHHTFFEMLGNWSFDDYGKPQACEWALDFLVNHLGLKEELLHVTYHADDREEDIETKDIWLKLGIHPQRVKGNGDGDNFWDMGETGPCGVSTEIFYPVDGELLEVWNLVFIDRQMVSQGRQMVPLRSKFVDTGMGLERMLTVLQGSRSNYDTDLFSSLFKVIESKSNLMPYSGSLEDQLDINYRTLVDHSRMITIALADGVEPGRKGADFELRTVIKKSVLIARDVFKIQTPRYLLFDLVDEVVDILKDAYPYLPSSVKKIRSTIAFESKRYLKYLDKVSTSTKQ